MNIALWITQGLLAFAFAGAGFMKLTTPMPDLIDAGMGGWVADSPELLIRFIGLSELLGAAGLILPQATRIQSWLTPLAAACLGLVMVLAGLTHAAYGEVGSLVPNVVLFGLTGFVAWGRYKGLPAVLGQPAAG